MFQTRRLPRIACCARKGQAIAWKQSCRARDTSDDSEPGDVTLTCVLVVEDDPWIQWMIADDLADRGYEVKTAQDGLEALAHVTEIQPDVIVLDLMLPRSSGWDFVERYQAIAGGDVIPTVVVSAARDAAVSLTARGVQRYLRKPFDIEELARAVDDLTGRPLATTAM